MLDFSNDSKNIISDEKGEHIQKELENKYKNSKITFIKHNIKGLLEEDIPITEDFFGYDSYYLYPTRADELDSIFEVDGHTVETYISCSINKDEDGLYLSIEADYDNNKDKYCYVGVSFTKSDFEE